MGNRTNKQAQPPTEKHEKWTDSLSSTIYEQLEREEDSTLTFKVDDVEICKIPPSHLKSAHQIIHALVTPQQKRRDRFQPADPPKIEDHSHRCDSNRSYLASEMHGFIQTLHTAYAQHYHLQLSPSDFIILIGQGLSRHISNNAEKLRKNFVNHEGKKTLIVQRDNFVLGEYNNWSSVFGEFTDQIKDKVKTDIYDVVIDDTSVATPITRIVSEITLMDCMKHYFEYACMTGCGIPKITLKGTPEDWEKLRQKVYKLKEMNQGDCLELDWWLEKLVPVVDKICDTGSKNQVCPEFWKRIYKFEQFYLTTSVTGWITVFFPYLHSDSRNNFINPIDTKSFPKQISDVPLKWSYYGKMIPMRICAGFLGAHFDKKSCALETAYFWSVVHDKKENETS